jgi:predicted RNA-binding Zn ribbon-like protein
VSVDVNDFRFYSGSLATDFVATVGRRRAGGQERLTSPGRLIAWLDAVALCPRGTQATDAQLADAKELREAMYRLMRVSIGESLVADGDVEMLNGWARRLSPVPQLDGSGPFTLRLIADNPVGNALAAVAGDAVCLLTGLEAVPLRACQASDCGMIYLDYSQSRSRRWCSMRECGNRAKVAAHRARQSGGAV